MQVSANILEIIRNSTTEGPRLMLPGVQLDRKTYVAVNEALTLAGGRWVSKQKAHVFDGDAAEAIADLLDTGEILDPKEFGYFPTPPEVVELMISHADIGPGLTYLEPSAGKGAIALALCDLEPERIECFELLSDNANDCEAALRGHPSIGKDPGRFAVIVGDFLGVEPENVFDRVMMNPPFAKQADARHIDHAWRFLRPGGVLVSIVPTGFLTRSFQPTRALLDELQDAGMRYFHLPDGSFKGSGTAVNTAMIVVRKPE